MNRRQMIAGIGSAIIAGVVPTFVPGLLPFDIICGPYELKNEIRRVNRDIYKTYQEELRRLNDIIMENQRFFGESRISLPTPT